MIGNDIVDLELAKVQSGWRRKGFLDKAYSSNEQAMILASINPDITVWRLWSMKESVYKARLRVEKQIRINPKTFDCQILSENLGKVICDGMVYYTKSVIKDSYVYSQAQAEEFDMVLFSKVINLGKDNLDSEKLYAIVKSDIAIRKGWKEIDLMIKKNEIGIPEVYHKGAKNEILISLSHHGRFGAYLST